MSKKKAPNGGRGGARPGAGRPKSDVETQVVAVRLPKAMVKALDEYAKKMKSPRGSIIHDAILHVIKEY